MPIKFRCAYCNQLMGIARRKAGTVVCCPTCSGQVVVPSPEAEAPPEGPPGPPPGGPALFERSDFGQDLFQNAQPSAARSGSTVGGGFLPAPPQLPAAPPPSPASGYDVAPAPLEGAGANPAPLPPVTGIFLTTGKVTVLAVLVVLLIGVAFFAGMLVGRS
jgi:hypothetical protein